MTMKIWQPWKRPTARSSMGQGTGQIPIYLELKNEPFGDRRLDDGGLESGGGNFGTI